MKKITLFALIIITILSCGDEVQFNSPAFLGSRNGNQWQAETFSASIDENGFLTLTGSRNSEILQLRIPSVAVGTYVLGNVNSMEARFITSNGTVFSTNNRPDPSVSIYPEIGEIRLDEIADNTFTGTFRFNAFDASGLDVVNFTGLTREEDINGNPIFGGTFFRIPLTSGEIPLNVITCDDTIGATTTARIAYEATFMGVTFVNDAAYTAACNAYRTALNTQRDYCADLDNALQNIIDGLGDCQFTCELALANRAEAENQFTPIPTAETYIALCQQYQQFLQQEIMFCGDPDGSIQATIDSLNCTDTDNDGLADVFEDFNLDGDLDNDDFDADGTADFMDTDDDGDNVLTANELQFDMLGNPGDTDGDGIADYFDLDDDGDGLSTIFEDVNGNGDPTDDDTDGDGIPNYLDNDDDGDGIPTNLENPDLNGDGNPADALDSDGNGTPDYLQA